MKSHGPVPGLRSRPSAAGRCSHAGGAVHQRRGHEVLHVLHDSTPTMATSVRCAAQGLCTCCTLTMTFASPGLAYPLYSVSMLGAAAPLCRFQGGGVGGIDFGEGSQGESPHPHQGINEGTARCSLDLPPLHPLRNVMDLMGTLWASACSCRPAWNGVRGHRRALRHFRTNLGGLMEDRSRTRSTLPGSAL